MGGSNTYLRKVSKLILASIVIVVLALLPLVTTKYYLLHATNTVILILFALSFNLVYGYLGELPLGQGGFFGLAAYIVFLSVLLAKIDMILAVLLSLCGVTIYGLLVAFLTRNLSGIYFALCHLALGQLIAIMFWSNVEWGGDVGLHMLIIPLTHLDSYYYIALVIVLACLFILYRIMNSPFGLAVQCIRDCQARVTSLGISMTRYKVIAITISAIFSGVAGILYAVLHSMVHPRFCSWEITTIPLLGALLGGSRSFWGPIIGTAIYNTVYWYISETTVFWQYWAGALAVVLITFFPEGIIGYVTKARTRTAPSTMPLR